MKNRHSHDLKLVPASFFCDDCISKDPRAVQDRTTIDFSEAKEEESECYYCNLSGMPRPAEVLFNGFPSCRECRRRRNVMNFVAKTNENNQKVIVTQVSLNKEGIQASYHRHHESSPFNKQVYDPRFASQELQFSREGLMTTPRGHNPGFSMALPAGISMTQTTVMPQSTRTRKHTVGDPSTLTKKNGLPGNPLTISTDEVRYDGQGYKFPMVRSGSPELGNIQPMPMQMPQTTKHDRSEMHAGVDIFKVVKTPSFTLNKPQPNISDPKVINFFKKINEGGIQAVKGQLVFTTNSDGFSGRKFHQRCDKKSPIILVISLDNGFKIGGFTYKGIDPKSVEVSDNLCGLFCTYDCKKVDFYSVGNSKVVYQPFGVAFGSPIILNLNLEALNTFVCQLELGFYDPNGNRQLYSFEEKLEWEKLIKEFAVYTLK